MSEGNNLLIYSFSLSFSCEKCHCNIPVVVEGNSMQTEQDPDMASTIRTAVQWANRVVNQQGEDIQCNRVNRLEAKDQKQYQWWSVQYMEKVIIILSIMCVKWAHMYITALLLF